MSDDEGDPRHHVRLRVVCHDEQIAIAVGRAVNTFDTAQLDGGIVWRLTLAATRPLTDLLVERLRADRSTNVVRVLAQNPDLGDDTLDALCSHRNAKVRAEAVFHRDARSARIPMTNTQRDLDSELAEATSAYQVDLVCNAAGITDTAARGALVHPHARHATVCYLLAANPDVSAEVLDEIAHEVATNSTRGGGDGTWAHLAVNPTTAEGTIVSMIADRRPWFDFAVAHPHCPPEVASATLRAYPEMSVHGLGASPDLHPDVACTLLELLAGRSQATSHSQLWIDLATNPVTPPAVLRGLARLHARCNTWRWGLSAALATNPATPLDVARTIAVGDVSARDTIMLIGRLSRSAAAVDIAATFIESFTGTAGQLADLAADIAGDTTMASPVDWPIAPDSIATTTPAVTVEDPTERPCVAPTERR